MRARFCVAAVTVASLTLGGAMGLPAVSGGVVGVSTASAAGFYTRKRVNGEWITGHFAKPGPSGRRRASRRTGSRHTATRHSRRQHVVRQDRRDRQRDASQRETSSPPPREPSVDTTGALATLAPMSGPSAVSAVPAGDPRLSKLRDALQVRAREIAVTAPPAAATAPGAASLDTGPRAGIQRLCVVAGRVRTPRRQGGLGDAAPAQIRLVRLRIRVEDDRFRRRRHGARAVRRCVDEGHRFATAQGGAPNGRSGPALTKPGGRPPARTPFASLSSASP